MVLACHFTDGNRSVLVSSFAGGGSAATIEILKFSEISPLCRPRHGVAREESHTNGSQLYILPTWYVSCKVVIGTVSGL